MGATPYFKWGNNVAAAPSAPPRIPGQSTQKPFTFDNSMEAMLKDFMNETKAQYQSHGAAIKNLENQISHRATTISQSQIDLYLPQLKLQNLIG